MRNHSLQRRLLLAALVPVVLFTLVLGILLIGGRFQDLADLVDDQARLTLTRQQQLLAANAETEWPHLAVNALEDRDVRSLSVIDHRGHTLVHAGPQRRQQLPALGPHISRLRGEDTWLYTQPLRPDRWLVMEISASRLTLTRYQFAGLVLLILLGGVVATAVWVYRRVEHLTEPLHQLRLAIQRLESDRLNEQLEIAADGEIGELASDLNRLLHALSSEQEDLKSSMMQANDDLRETLEALEVQNIELSLARKEAVEGNRVKSEFLANISHEIRTPLNGIMGFARLLLKTRLSTRQLDYVQTIQKSSDSLLAIINDVLDLSKIEAGKLVLEHSPFDIEDLVHEVLSMLAPFAEEKQLETVAFIYDDVPRQILGDPLRLKQILTNLINNAIKFTAQGEVVVRVMLEELQDEQSVLRLSVSDTGIGLSDTARQELFRAFSQGDASTSRKYGGTGLGLVICKHLIELMGGEISVDSQEGQGSTFWFTLPARLHGSPLVRPPQSPLQGSSALVAEPHPVSRDMVAGTLSQIGLRPTAVAGLPDVLDQLDKRRYDLLILSQSLVGRQADTLALIQGRHLGPIVLLNRASDGPQDPGNEGDRIRFLNKPVHGRLLHQQLLSLLAGDEHPALLPGPVAAVPSRSLHVLAVDDNAANLKLVQVLLEDMGLTVTACASGQAAVEACRGQRFDLVLMDIQMPDMNGIEATRQIRSEEGGGRRLPIVALTAHALANEKEALLREGMDDYLTKPVNESQLAHVIARWTGVDQSRLQPAPVPLEALPETAARPDALVDETEGLLLASGKADLARDMLDMLLGSLEEQQLVLREALASNRLDTLLARVHYLHGATRYCGVPRLRRNAEQLETLIKQRRANGQQHCAGFAEPVQSLLSVLDDLIRWREQRTTTV